MIQAPGGYPRGGGHLKGAPLWQMCFFHIVLVKNEKCASLHLLISRFFNALAYHGKAENTPWNRFVTFFPQNFIILIKETGLEDELSPTESVKKKQSR